MVVISKGVRKVPMQASAGAIRLEAQSKENELILSCSQIQSLRRIWDRKNTCQKVY